MINYVELLREKYQLLFEELTLEYGMDAYLLGLFGKVKSRIDAFEEILQDPQPKYEIVKDMWLYIRQHPEEESEAIEKEIDGIKPNYLKIKPQIND